MDKLRGFRTYITSGLIVIAGAILAYNQSCEANHPDTIQACELFTFPGWIISVLGVAAGFFRKLANTGK